LHSTVTHTVTWLAAKAARLHDLAAASTPVFAGSSFLPGGLVNAVGERSWHASGTFVAYCGRLARWRALQSGQARRATSTMMEAKVSTSAPTPQSATRRRETMYERYLRTGELLALQRPASERLHPDELTFQVVHQTFELWWKVTIELFERAAVLLDADQPVEAAPLLRRAVSAQGVVMAAMRQIEFIGPREFLRIREGLGDGSGADSPGFRAILRGAPRLWASFAGALGRAGVSLLALYQDPDAQPALYDCAESLTDFDEQFHVFRAQHIKLAQRNLGPRAIGTGGTPIPALERTLQDLLFPPLWEVRDALLAEAQRQS
jgi:tryptophan 2,3-dioxygenase